MGDRPCKGFMSQELHWLHHYYGPSHIVGNDSMLQNLFGKLVNQHIGLPVMSARGNDSSRQISNSLPSNAKAPLRKHPRPRSPNPVLRRVLDGVLYLATVPVIAPIERVYLLMQCQNEMIKSGRLSSPYVGMKDCFFRTIKNDGVLSLWRGSSVVITRYLATEALLFSYKKYGRCITGYNKNAKADPKNSYTRDIIIVSVLSGLLIYPLDYARTRLATDVKSVGATQFSLDSARKTLEYQARRRQFTGFFDVLLKTLKSDGIVGLYRGYSLCWLGCAPHAVIAAEIKDFHRTAKQKQDRQRTLLARMFPSFIMFSLKVAHYPFHSVSRRMMMTSGEAEKYKGVTDAVRQIVKHEGFRSMYKGVTAYVMLAGAKNATFALAFSALHVLLQPK